MINRTKQGFGVPVYEWCFGALGDRVKRELHAFCGQTDFIDRRAVDRLIEQRQGPQLWYLLNLAMWWKRFIAEDPTPVEPFSAGAAAARPFQHAEPVGVA